MATQQQRKPHLNPYDVLGVRPCDEFSTIRAAWRKLARAHHPDVVGGCPKAATRKFAEINDAYDQLSTHRPPRQKSEAERAAEARLRARLRRRAEAQQRAMEAREAEAQRAEAKGRQEHTRAIVPSDTRSDAERGAARALIERALKGYCPTLIYKPLVDLSA